MSEYQYYEFQAVDRPLDKAAISKLRSISSRAQISSTSFVNRYNWGDLNADPIELLGRYFDLFLYKANWGTRRFALRVPHQAIDLTPFDRYDIEEFLQVKKTKSGLIIDITRNNEEDVYEEDDDEGLRLPALASLRTAFIGGDTGLIAVVWLMLVDVGLVEDDVGAPVAFSGKATAALVELAEFLTIDADLIAAAFGNNAAKPSAEPTEDQVRAVIRALPDEDKTSLLLRLHSGDDPHLSATFRRQCKAALDATRGVGAPGRELRTAGALRAAAQRSANERQRRAERKEAKAREQRVAALAARETEAWRELEGLINLRNQKGYREAAALLSQLRELAEHTSRSEEFSRRMTDVATRHERKGQFTRELIKAELIRSEP